MVSTLFLKKVVKKIKNLEAKKYKYLYLNQSFQRDQIQRFIGEH
jgi:hypothetical protein